MPAIGLTVLVAQLVATVVNGFTGLFTSLFQAAGLVTPAIALSMAQGILFVPIVLLGDLWFGLAGIMWALTRTEVLVFLAGVGIWLASRGRIDRGLAAGSEERAEAALEQATVRRGARPGGAGAAGGASAPQGRVPLRATPLRSRASSA
ncbi:hypothetical protein [Curtobacterium sp. MCPF17_046]|uniref:hypothetical protein n=1 Tax=Curtobacterium sp. MCPF17_046 TaxID=2175663 RepID=UPI000D887078|nr:hypothetical protein [Curtobacterium sp. MCPF17_046]